MKLTWYLAFPQLFLYDVFLKFERLGVLISLSTLSMQKRNAKKAESEKKYYAEKKYVSGD